MVKVHLLILSLYCHRQKSKIFEWETIKSWELTQQQKRRIVNLK